MTVSIKVNSKAKGQFDLPDIGVCLEPTRGCGSGNSVASCLQGGEAVVTLKDGFMLPATVLRDPDPVCVLLTIETAYFALVFRTTV
jgi:hypothetical protein